jgi:hypothetical protein
VLSKYTYKHTVSRHNNTTFIANIPTIRFAYKNILSGSSLNYVNIITFYSTNSETMESHVITQLWYKIINFEVRSRLCEKRLLVTSCLFVRLYLGIEQLGSH